MQGLILERGNICSRCMECSTFRPKFLLSQNHKFWWCLFYQSVYFLVSNHDEICLTHEHKPYLARSNAYNLWHSGLAFGYHASCAPRWLLQDFSHNTQKQGSKQSFYHRIMNNKSLTFWPHDRSSSTCRGLQIPCLRTPQLSESVWLLLSSSSPCQKLRIRTQMIRSQLP